ncbi:MAG: hypothetical protein KIS92_00565 [Planctomycetota bacterium]|nr:hypothetical protein [Planctomycetota bacterium]
MPITMTHSRRLSNDPMTVLGVAPAQPRGEGTTWRGWVTGLLALSAICLVTPIFDYAIGGTMLANSLFPATAVASLLALGALLYLASVTRKSYLGFTRGDLALVFMMVLVSNTIPGGGFWAFWVTNVSGGFFNTPEAGWEKTVLPHVPAAWVPQDEGGLRPLEWFYRGLPNHQGLSWGLFRAWLPTYGWWCLALAFMLAMLFALSSLLRKQWADHEQLPFPLAQIPHEMIKGIFTTEERPLLRDPMMLWGLGLTFAFVSWNSLADYYNFVPAIPTGNWLSHYLSEDPWNRLNPVYCKIYFSVVALTFMLSKDVSFSLWFYHIVWFVLVFVLCGMGVGNNGQYFWNSAGAAGFFVDQGTGALLALTAMGLWMARAPLWGSLQQALGLRARDTGEDEDLSPRALWGLLAAGFVGSLAWMQGFGMDLLPSVLIVVLMLLIMTGLTRLCCEGGLFFMQVGLQPNELLHQAFTPVQLGAQNFVRLEMWNRSMVVDGYRVFFMANIMNGLQLARLAGLKRRTAMGGMALAIVAALAVSFFAFLHTAYTYPGGASAMMPWYFEGVPTNVYKGMSQNVRAIETYKQKEASGAAEKMASADVPAVAKRDGKALTYLALGASFLVFSMVLRKYVFWFPHPIGYVMWMGPFPVYQLWFSFMLGWFFKYLVLKFGTTLTYQRAKRLFLGMLVGESAALIVWKLISWGTGVKSTLRVLPF